MTPDATILEHFGAIRQRTRELLSAIPDEHLATVAQGEERPIAYWFRHVALANFWWLCALRDEASLDAPRYGLERADLERALDESEQAVLRHFAESGNWERTVHRSTHDGRPADWNGRERLLYLVAHEVHHRAKWALTLRQAGFTDIPTLPLDW